MPTNSRPAAVTPFWERLPSCFTAPLRPTHLMLYALVTVAGAVLSGVFNPATAMSQMPFLLVSGLALMLIFVWLVGGSAFRVMDAGARGLFDPETDAADPIDSALRSLPWRMFGVQMVTGMVAGVFAAASPALALVAQLLLIVAWPAQLVLLVRDQSFVSAINPARWWEVMHAMGKPYLALVLFLWLLSAGTGVAAALVLPHVGVRLLLPVLLFVIAYFAHAMAYLMAYAMFQYHEPLGFEPDARSGLGQREDGPAARIAELIADGDIAAALAEGYDDQQRNPDSPAAHERYHRVLMLAGEHERALAHGRRQLALLLDKGMTGEALKLLTELRGLDSEWRPDNPAHELPLAQAALRRQQPELALALLRGFDKRHRGHEQVPAVYLFTARLLATHYRDTATARAILLTLLNRHGQAPAAVEARILLDSLDAAPGR
ncbi:tetratricopeptide repeat protein [Derxia lacustris]|uniref:tetratricopeptide repeat protein n=1 Tax=Derxia lacustris TaxID=764842 RepID=UPI000A173CF7|nr:hypothetical protein [Derxia lacustris]